MNKLFARKGLVAPYLLTLAMILGIVLPSCRKELPTLDNPDEYRSGSYKEEFDAFWKGMNNNYMFWDVDPTDWDTVYKKYAPIFAQLKWKDTADTRKAFSYYRDMTSTLVDGHYSISSVKNIELPKGLQTINPARDRHLKDPSFHQPDAVFASLYASVVPTYLRADYRSGDYTTISGTTIPLTTRRNNNYMSGKIKADTNLLYFRWDQFAITQFKRSFPATSNVVVAIDYFLNQLNAPDLKGIILDVRGNGGGLVMDMKEFLGFMVPSSHLIGYTHQKIGNGRLDYAPWVPVYLEPNKYSPKKDLSIVVLADVNSVSMAELTTIIVKSLPKGKFVGENTWGGVGGAITGENITANGGVFATSLFTQIYTPSFVFRDRNKVSSEGKGVVPDIEVKYNADAVKAGRDPQLEAAITALTK